MSVIFGVLIDWFFGGYQYELIKGIEGEAKKRGISIIYFTGRQFDSNLYSEALFNRIYELIDKDYLGGIIVPVPVMNKFKSDRDYAHLNRLIPVPVVTLAFEYHRFPSVCIDNREGFRNLLDHMVHKHGFRKFAMANGSRDHPDAIKRYAIYQEILASNNIPFDENKVIFGNFISNSGIDAVKTFLDVKKLKIKEDIEVIICANDLIALGVIEELEARGFSVPGDVAVTGFDDIEDGRNRTIALTTVRQPIRELGEEAVKVLALKQKDKTYLATRFIPRGTCGCPLSYSQFNFSPPEGMEIRAFLIQGVRKIISSDGDYDESFNEELVDIFLQPFSGRSLEDIKLKIYILLSNGIEKWGDLKSWQGIFIFLEGNLSRRKNFVEKKMLFQYSQMLIADLFQGVEKKKRKRAERWEERLRWVNERLRASPDLNDISAYLSNILPGHLNIPKIFILLYNHPGDYKYDFTLLQNSPPADRQEKVKNQEFHDFAAIVNTQLAPEGRFSYVVMPLIFEELSMGFVIMDFFGEASMVYESLRIHLSTALNNSFTIIESENRNRELKKLQNQLVQSAHKAGMAQIAINLMHTIGNISNSAYVTIDLLNNSLKDSVVPRFHKANKLLKNNIHDPEFFFRKDPRGKILPEYYEKLTEILVKDQNLVKEHIEELTEIISGMVRVIDSQQELSEGFFILESVNLIECLENSLTLTADAVKKAEVRLIRDYNAMNKYNVMCYKNTLLHILVKLLESALSRTIESGEKIITVSISPGANNTILKIAFTGRRINKEELIKIFSQDYEPQFVNAGVDLHFIANTLKEIGASIHAESDGEDDGAVFIITFPPPT